MKVLDKYAGEKAMLEAAAGYGDLDAKALLEENMKLEFQDKIDIFGKFFDENQEISGKQIEPDSVTGIWRTNEKHSLIELLCKWLNQKLPALLEVMNKESAESSRELGLKLVQLGDRVIRTPMFEDFNRKLKNACLEIWKLAILCFQVAAEKGDKGAQYDLGVLLFDVENYSGAVYWLSMASRNGRKTYGNSLERQLIPCAKLKLGKEYYNNGENKQAIECLEECIREGIDTDTWVVEAKKLLSEIDNG